MPEEPEVETEKLHEAIQEEFEREGGGGRFLRQIALTTAILAALASVASLRAGATVNEALVLKTESTRLQAEASDQWAYYQAKGIKSAVQESLRTTWSAAGKPVPPDVDKKIQQYAADQKEITKAAQEKEHERDQKSEEADRLMER